MGKQFLSHFVYSNLFIAGCALLMTDSTARLLLEHPPATDLLAFIFFSTICSYSFHWWLSADPVSPSPRSVWLKKYRFVHLLLFFTGFAGAVIYFFRLTSIWPWLLVSAVVTFLYSAPKIPHPLFRSLRRVALGKTIFLAFVWMFVTTVLPLVHAGGEWNPVYTYFVISRFFFIYAICILFDYRDRADDKAAGIRSLITFLPEKGIHILFYTSLVISTLTAMMMYGEGYSTKDIAALIIPCIITAVIYKRARTHFADMFYYFALDGLMALSAILMWVFSI